MPTTSHPPGRLGRPRYPKLAGPLAIPIIAATCRQGIPSRHSIEFNHFVRRTRESAAASAVNQTVASGSVPPPGPAGASLMSASTAHLVSRDSPPVPAESGIVFFDGVCGMCNRFVDLLLKLDRQGRLKFAPLQGETAERLLSERDVASLETVVFLKDGRAYRSSSAAVRIWWQLGGFWKCAAACFGSFPSRCATLDIG